MLFASVMLAWLATALPLLSDMPSALLQEGQVAGRDYLAPHQVTYVSQVLTEQRREAAAHSVVPIYTSPDASVARRQIDLLRQALAQITLIRLDTQSSTVQKTGKLTALQDVSLEADTALTLLGMTDTRWRDIQDETLEVLEKVMSSPIQPEGIQDALNRLPALVSLSLPEVHAEVVADLVSAYVTPNSFYDQALTQAAQQAARAKAEPVERTFVADQSVVLRGDVLDAADIEALHELGYLEPEEIWPELVSITALVVLMAVFMVLYFRLEPRQGRQNPRVIPLVASLFIIFLFGGRLILPYHIVLPYAFPLAAYSLTVAALYGSKLALITTLPLSILLTYGMPNALELTLFYIMGSSFGVLAVGRARRMASFFWAGAAVAFAGMMTILAFRLQDPSTDFLGMATLFGATMVNGLASASITLVLQYTLAQFMGMTTPMQLVDLTRPDHPLMQLLLQQAPGTYQHSLQVANLAEQAAERIGADSLLTRVGTLYHDVGKTQNPMFFIENQHPGFISPHQGLTGYQSADMIIRHVAVGLELADKHRLPRAIRDFIEQHHGTLITLYQYAQAVNEAAGDESQVDIDRFRYPGPIPQSREVAILMLADGCEARIRAERPSNEEQLDELIKGMVKDRFTKGQLDDTNLTFHDLTSIQESFLISMRVIFHPRVKYPSEEVNISPDTAPSRGKKGSELPAGLEPGSKLPAEVSPQVAHGTKPS